MSKKLVITGFALVYRDKVVDGNSFAMPMSPITIQAKELPPDLVDVLVTTITAHALKRRELPQDTQIVRGDEG